MPRAKKETKPKAEKAEKKVEKKSFSFQVKVNDLVYKSKASDLQTALDEFVKSPEYPVGVKTPVVITYGVGKEVKTKIIPVAFARRLFRRFSVKDTARELFAGKLTLEL